MPNSSEATANFGTSTITTIYLNDTTSVGQMVFGANNAVPAVQKSVNFLQIPQSGSFTVETNGNNLYFYGQGIVNNSGQTQTIFNGGSVIDPTIYFFNSSSASNAVLINAGANDAIFFEDNSTAGASTITNQGAFSHVIFLGNASGGMATIINASPTSYIDISRIQSASLTIGAIEGVGTIYLGDKNLAVGANNLSTVFSGVISDGTSIFDTDQPGARSGRLPFLTGGSLTKIGTGTLTLAGANTYTGNTYVNGGTLLVDGSIQSPITFVNPGATLGGTGFIGGSVINNGFLQPGDAPGTITIKGNYLQGPIGTLTIQLASSTVYDQVAVNGAAILGGTLQVDPLSSFKFKRGETFDILLASGGVAGRFFNVVQPNNGTLEQFTAVYSANEVILEARTRPFNTLQGLTPNQSAIAQDLNLVLNNSRENNLINYLTQQSLSQLPGDLDLLVAEELSAIFALGTSFNNIQSINLQRRNEDIRLGASGFSSSGFITSGNTPTYSGGFGFAGPNGSDGKESKDMKTAAAPEEDRWGAFITGVGEWVGVGDDFNARGYNMDSGGFTLGVDYKFCSHFAMGLMAGYVGTGVDLNQGGRVLVNGGKVGIYGTAFGSGLYADFAVTGGYSSYDTRRNGLQGTARGDTDGGDLNVLYGMGYDFKAGGLSFGPTASFNYTYVGLRDFSETGSLAPLHFNSQGQDSLRTSFGAKASYDWKIGTVLIKPELRAAWQHEYGIASYALDSSFASGAGDVFQVNGPKIGRDSFLLGAGFSIQLNPRTATYVYYDGELGRERFNSQNVSGGFRVSF